MEEYAVGDDHKYKMPETSHGRYNAQYMVCQMPLNTQSCDTKYELGVLLLVCDKKAILSLMTMMWEFIHSQHRIILNIQY